MGVITHLFYFMYWDELSEPPIYVPTLSVPLSPPKKVDPSMYWHRLPQPPTIPLTRF